MTYSAKPKIKESSKDAKSKAPADKQDDHSTIGGNKKKKDNKSSSLKRRIIEDNPPTPSGIIVCSSNLCGRQGHLALDSKSSITDFKMKN